MMPTLPWAGQTRLLVIAKRDRRRVPGLQNLVLSTTKWPRPLPPVSAPSHFICYLMTSPRFYPFTLLELSEISQKYHKSRDDVDEGSYYQGQGSPGQ